VRLIQLIAGHGEWGTDTVAYCLGEGVRAADHQVIYAANPDFLRHYGLEGNRQVVWPMKSFRWPSPRQLLAFNRLARGADLVLAHDSGARHFGLLAKLFGLQPPLWFMRHCLSGTTRVGGVQLHRLLVAQQIAVSQAVRNSLLASGFPADRVTRIYGGLNLEQFQRPDADRVEELRARFLDHRLPDTVVLGIVARINFGPRWRVDREDYKGYDLLFQALAQARFRYRVLVLGPEGSSHQEAVRQLAAHYGADVAQLRFTGFVRDPANYYPLMDVNVLPSRGEGLGLTLIESMAAGVATVGSRSGGAAEIIDHENTGLLFEQGNATDLAAQLTRLARDTKLRQTLALRGQSAVMTRFDADVMVRAFCGRVAQVLGRETAFVPFVHSSG
jgi:glycosyltransferase involved in cell wall biosynthesis